MPHFLYVPILTPHANVHLSDTSVHFPHVNDHSFIIFVTNNSILLEKITSKLMNSAINGMSKGLIKAVDHIQLSAII